MDVISLHNVIIVFYYFLLSVTHTCRSSDASSTQMLNLLIQMLQDEKTEKKRVLEKNEELLGEISQLKSGMKNTIIILFLHPV